MSAFLSVLGAFWRLDAAENATLAFERLSLIARVAAIGVLLWFGRTLVAVERDAVMGATGFLLWALTGYAALAVFRAGLLLLRERIRRYQLSGTLEACLMTGVPPWRVIAAMPVHDVASTFALALAVVGLAIPFADGDVSALAALTAFGYALVGLLATLGLGMISGAVVLATRQNDPIAQALSVLAAVVSGAFVPRDLFPAPLAWIGAWLPIGSSLDGIRAALADLDAGDAAFRLALVTVVAVPGGLLALRVAVRQMLRDGTTSY